VREALRRLAALGLVSFVPNRGVRVRTISREELHEAFMVRAELESLATEVARRRSRRRSSRSSTSREAVFEISQELRSREPGDERRSIMATGCAATTVPRHHLSRRGPATRRADGEERAPHVLGPAVWAPGDHSLDGLYLKNAEQHRAIKQALAAGSAAGARALAREHVLSSFTAARDDLSRSARSRATGSAGARLAAPSGPGYDRLLMEMEPLYRPHGVEERWQRTWEEEGHFHADPFSDKEATRSRSRRRTSPAGCTWATR